MNISRIFLIAVLLLGMMTTAAVSADENATDANPVDDISVSYADTYGDVLINPQNTYDIYISRLPDECGPDEFTLFIDDETVGYDVIEHSKDLNQICAQYRYNYTMSNHTLKVDFKGNGHYQPTSKAFAFNATDAVIYIPSTVTQGISADRSVEVYLAPDVQGTVTVNADGNLFSKQDISNRLTRFPLDSLGFGEHDIEVSFKNHTISKRINVTYYLEIQSVSEMIYVRMPWDGAAEPLIYIDGEKYKFSKEGIKYAKNGEHTVVATYPGDAKYPEKTVNATIRIANHAAVTGPASLSVFTTDSKKITFQLWDKYGNPADGEIYVTLNKKGKTLKTKNGKATYTIPSLKPGKYSLTAYDMHAFIFKTTVTVKHVLTLKSVKIKKSAKKLTLQATLKNTKPIKNKKVTFKFNGKTYTAKTNSKGIAKVTVKSSILKKLKVGKKVTYQATYGKDTVKKTVKVKR